MKVDLAKAYNMLNYNFVHKVLMEIGLHDKITQVIMELINMDVLWMRKKEIYFTAHKDLQQRDFISPFIFVICMEKMSHLILNKVEKGNWEWWKHEGICQISLT